VDGQAGVLLLFEPSNTFVILTAVKAREVAQSLLDSAAQIEAFPPTIAEILMLPERPIDGPPLDGPRTRRGRA
jgi:hypothetical protein